MNSLPLVADGRYRPIRPIGAGGMGSVFLSRDGILDRLVAVKVPDDQFAADPRFRERFQREAKLAARLSHPNVVAVYDAGEQDDRPYLVMEYVDGEPLSALLTRSGRRPPAEAVALAAQLASGLAHAHGLGVVHRDVKPHNVLVRPDGTAKLADFGIARAVDAATRADGVTVAGTAGYMAPEQALGEAGPPADVYALGAVLHEILTGRPPPRPATPSADLAAIDAALAALVAACLQADPAARPTAAAVATRLADPAGAAPTIVEVAPGPADEDETATMIAGDPAASAFAPPLDAARTVVAPPAGLTEVRASDPPPPPARPARRPWRMRPLAVVAASAIALVVALALGSVDDDPEPPAPVPAGTSPADSARQFADWLREQSR